MKRKLVLFIIVIFFSFPICVLTASPQNIQGNLGEFAGKTGIEEQSVTDATGSGIQFVLQLVGLIFFVLTIYAGIRWMTAQGNEQAVEEARNTLVAATIGLILVVGAYAITDYIASRAINEFSSGGGPASIPEGAGTPEAGNFDGEITPGYFNQQPTDGYTENSGEQLYLQDR